VLTAFETADPCFDSRIVLLFLRAPVALGSKKSLSRSG